MPVKSDYPNGFDGGVTIRGIPVLNTYGGNVFWVDSGAGSNGNKGTERRPFATLDYAVGRCTANNGDLIFIKDGHSETLTADSAVDIDVAGVTVIGLGSGANRPTFNFTTDTAADFKLAAANLTISNLLFTTGIASQDMMIEVSGDDAEIANCEFRNNATEQAGIFISLITANACDRAYIHHNRFLSATAGATSAISISAVQADVRIENNYIRGDFSDAAIQSASIHTNCVIKGNYIQNDNNGDHAIQFSTTATGVIESNILVTDAYATALDPGSCFCADNLYYDDGDTDKTGTPIPSDPTTGGVSLASVSGRSSISNNPFGDVYYVAASGGSDTAVGDGRDPKQPLATIAQAITNSAAGDTIVLGPGTHSVDVSAAALAPKANQQFIGAIPSYGGRPQAVITHDADDGANLVLLDVNGTFWKDITFLHVAGGSTAVDCVSISQTTAVTGATFVDCWFDQNSVDIADIASIAVDDATNATIGLTLKHCRFIGGDATTNVMQYVDVGVGGVPDMIVEDCTFVLESADGDGTAIRFADPGATDGSYAITIHHNRFIGPTDGGGDPTAIIFTGGTRDEIIGIISENMFAWCASTPVTQDFFNEGLVRNYVGDSATGGTLVDPGT